MTTRLMPQPMARRLLTRAMVQRVMADPAFAVGSYADLLLILNPLRAAEGYPPIATSGGVRGAALDLALAGLEGYVYQDRSPILIRNVPLVEEALVRHQYGQEALLAWRLIKHEFKFPLADSGQLIDVFGPGDPNKPG